MNLKRVANVFEVFNSSRICRFKRGQVNLPA